MTVLITGAAGNLGGKLRRHLEGRYPLRLLDLHTYGDKGIVECDLSKWDAAWVDQFRGVETVVHLAADATAQKTWPLLVAPNLDALINTYQAAVQSGVRRLVYASSNHVMGGYKDDPKTTRLTTDLPPRPGARYVVHGETRDSSAYGSAKLFGERLGRCYSLATSLSVIAVRLGWVQTGDNRAEDLPPEREAWFRLMWLSNRDYCQLMEKCILAPRSLRFAVVNGMSANTGMVWDIAETKRFLGYEPQDDVTRTPGSAIA
jgi:NAD+ dependent glucose-6-phosphate dehydrogenase